MKRDQSDIVLRWLLDDLSTADVAKLFGVPAPTIRRWKSKGVPESRKKEISEKYAGKTARESIETGMADAQQCTKDGLGGYPDVRIHDNKDGSVDAQLTVWDMPRGRSAQWIITTLAECARALGNTFNTFIQVGMRWGVVGTSVPRPSGDRRYRGLNEGSTFYYHASGLGRTFVKAIDIAANVDAKSYNRKIENVFVRLHWNPDGVAPKDWNPKKSVYRAYKRKGP